MNFKQLVISFEEFHPVLQAKKFSGVVEVCTFLHTKSIGLLPVVRKI